MIQSVVQYETDSAAGRDADSLCGRGIDVAADVGGGDVFDGGVVDGLADSCRGLGVSCDERVPDV